VLKDLSAFQRVNSDGPNYLSHLQKELEETLQSKMVLAKNRLSDYAVSSIVGL